MESRSGRLLAIRMSPQLEPDYPRPVRAGDHDRDLAALPDEVRRSARVFANGEVAWPNEWARDAINALADSGRSILGLDARTLYPDGCVMEVPVSSSGLDVEAARRAALEALPDAVAAGTHVLITWE
jgi:hypothetical protein